MNVELETVKAQRNAAQDAIAQLNQQLHEARAKIAELEEKLSNPDHFKRAAGDEGGAGRV